MPVYITYCQKSKGSFNAHFKSLLHEVDQWNPDLVYHRFFHYNRYLIELLVSKIGILEINTNDLTEYRLTMPWPKYIIHRIRRRWLFKKASGFVTVTKELESLLKEFDKPTLVCANGIDLSEYVGAPPAINSRPVLTFLGFPGYPWHGIDKVFQLAKMFPNWEFNIVGYTAENFKEKIPPHMTVHGYLSKENYHKVLCATDIGIGSLALHRNFMNEACPLKSREYLAYGIPMIIAYKDPDFMNEPPFLLRLPNEENAIISHTEEIRKFVERWQGKRVDRKDIAHLDINYKAQRQIAFFRNILKSRTIS